MYVYEAFPFYSYRKKKNSKKCKQINLVVSEPGAKSWWCHSLAGAGQMSLTKGDWLQKVDCVCWWWCEDLRGDLWLCHLGNQFDISKTGVGGVSLTLFAIGQLTHCWSFIAWCLSSRYSTVINTFWQLAQSLLPSSYRIGSIEHWAFYCIDWVKWRYI